MGRQFRALPTGGNRRVVPPPVGSHLAERSASGEGPLQVGHLGQQRLLEDGVLGVEERHASQRLERPDHAVDLLAHVLRDKVACANRGANNAQALVGERHRLWNARRARLAVSFTLPVYAVSRYWGVLV